MPSREPVPATRRDFLRTSAAALAGGTLASPLPQVHAAGKAVLRVGLIGCGGRGTGAAAQALKADKEVQLVAMGDAFEDRVRQSLAALKKDGELADKLDVTAERCFAGFDAYKQVIANSDVVLLCTPP